MLSFPYLGDDLKTFLRMRSTNWTIFGCLIITETSTIFSRKEAEERRRGGGGIFDKSRTSFSTIFSSNSLSAANTSYHKIKGIPCRSTLRKNEDRNIILIYEMYG